MIAFFSGQLSRWRWLACLLVAAAVGGGCATGSSTQGGGDSRSEADPAGDSTDDSSGADERDEPVPADVIEACQNVTFPAPDVPDAVQIPCDDDSRAAGWAAELTLYRVAEDQNAAAFEIFEGAPEGFELRRIGPTQVVAHRKLEELRSYVDGKVDDDHRIGFRFMPAPRTDGDTDRLDEDASFWHTVVLEKSPAMPLEGHVRKAAAMLDDALENPFLELKLTDKGTSAFHATTKQALDRNLAFVHGDFVISAPKIMEPIPGGSVYLPPPWGPSRDMDADEHSVVIRRGGSR